MKIKLLNDGGYHELQDEKFPFEVNAERCRDASGYEAQESEFGIKTGGKPFFFLDSEVEVVG